MTTKNIIVIILLFLALPAAAEMPSLPTVGSITLTANPASIPADGRSTTIITIENVENPDMPGYTILFGLINLSVLPELGTINQSVMLSNGTATAVLKAGTSPGVATIYAWYTGTNESRGRVNITFVASTAQTTPTTTYKSGGSISTPPGVTKTPVITATSTSAVKGTSTPANTSTVTETPVSNKTRTVQTPGLGGLAAISMLIAVYLNGIRRKKS